MKINVERGAFLKALSHVQSVVERRNTIPILSNVMLEAAKGSLKLTATDLDIEIVEALPADVLRNGSATINEIRARRGLGAIPGGDEPRIYTATGATPLTGAASPPSPVA